MQKPAALNCFSTSGYAGLYSKIFIASVFINLFVLAIPLFTMSVYDRVLPDFDQPTLVALTAGVMLALLFDFLLKVIRGIYLGLVSSSLAVSQDIKLFHNLLNSPQAAGMQVAKKLTLFREFSNTRQFVTGRLLPFLFDAPFFILFLLVIYWISPALSVIPLIGAIVLTMTGCVSVLVLGSLDESKDIFVNQKSNFLLETLAGTRTIWAFGAQKEKQSQWEKLLSQENKDQRFEHVVKNMLASFSGFVGLSVSVFVLFFGAYEVSINHLTLGGLIAISILSSRALAPVSNIVSLFGDYRLYRKNKGRICSDLSLLDDARQQPLLEKRDIAGALHASNVSFTYPGSKREALVDLTLEIPNRSRVGIIGGNGAGKSTLAKMISGVIQPDVGEVCLDGYHLEAISKEQRAAIISFCSSQDEFFFEGTLYDNVFLGVNSARKNSKNSIEEAVFLSGLDVVIRQNGFGWDMPIETGGANLSKGIRQSVSLARAFLKDPKILILDEPLDGLDHMLEKRIKEALPPWLEDRTFVMVTQRTSLLPLVDTLVLMEGGRIKAIDDRETMMKALA